MQGIRALAPSRLFPITMTDSGLSSEDKSEHLLPEEHRKMIIKVGAMEEVISTLALLFMVEQGTEHGLVHVKPTLPLIYTSSSPSWHWKLWIR